MREWWTAAEIAKRELPGLPGSKRGVNKLAQREWLAQRSPAGDPLVRAGTTGGIEYHVTLLPAAARLALAEAAVRPVAPEAASTPVASAELRDARLAVLQLQATYAAAAGATPRSADDAFAADWNAGRIAADAWVRGAVKKLSARTLRRWRSDAATDAARLGGKQGPKERTSSIEQLNEGGVAEAIAGILVHRPNMSAANVRGIVRGMFKDTFEITTPDGELVTVPLPQERAIREFMTRFKQDNRMALLKMTDPDRFRSHYQVSGLSRYGHLERLNQVWEIDASPSDAMCTDVRRPAVYALKDIWSKRVILYVSATPRSDAVSALVRKAIIAWGAPEVIKTDNGSDFTSKASRRALASLGIQHDLCAPFTPQHKGSIERVIGTMQRGLMTMLPGFAGHSVAGRKAIEARKSFADRLGQKDDKTFEVDMTMAELQAYADRWAEKHYAHQPHSSLPGRVSPFERAASYAGAVKKINDVRALDMLLAPIAENNPVRTVGKQGLKIDNAFFIGDGSSMLPGDKVLVRLDPADMGRVYCFTADGEQFLGEATCPERIGASRPEAVARARAAQNKHIKEGTAELRRAAKAIKPRDMVEGMLGGAEAAASAVVAFPKRAEAHTTPQIEAAAEAAMPRAERVARHAATPLTARVAEEHARMVEAYKAGNFGKSAPRVGAVVPMRLSPEQRFRRALDIEQALERGDEVPPADALWLVKYRETAEYKGHRATLDKLGPGLRTG